MSNINHRHIKEYLELRLCGNFLRPGYPYKKQNCNYLANYIRKNVTALYAAGKGGEGWEGERGGGEAKGKADGEGKGGGVRGWKEHYMSKGVSCHA